MFITTNVDFINPTANVPDKVTITNGSKGSKTIKDTKKTKK